MFRQGFSCPAPLVVCSVPPTSFRIRAITLYCRTFHSVLLTSYYHIQAVPISLATTLGISVDFFPAAT